MHTATTYKSRTLPTVHAHGTRPLEQCPFLGLSPVAIVILGRPVAPGATVGVKPAPAPVDLGPDPFGPTRDYPTTAYTLEEAVSEEAVSTLTVGLVKAKHTLNDTEYRELLDKVSFHVWTEQMEMDQREHPEAMAELAKA